MIHNRYRASGSRNPGPVDVQVNQTSTADLVPMPVAVSAGDAGCYGCGKCYCCKNNFLTPCFNFSSYHSEQVFPITKKLSCQSTNLIYLMECVTCKQSYVGYTTYNLPKRLSNHKSHLKKKIRSCKLVTHFLDIDHSLDFSTIQSYNTSLSSHLKVILLDSLDFDTNISKIDRQKAMETREGFYQTQLKTLERFGGMNTLDSNHILFRSTNS